MKKIRNALLLLCLFCGTAGTMAEGHGQDGRGRHNPELRKEIRTYTHDNIMPVLRQQRMEFERQLSAEDKHEIDRLRSQLQVLREERRGMRQSLPLHKDRTALGEEEKARRRAQREKQRQVMRAAQAIAARYSTQLEAISTDLADEKSGWAADVRAILEKYPTEGTVRKAVRPGKRHQRKSHEMVQGHVRLLRPDRFILWNAAQKHKARESAAFMVYPNPSAGISTVAYDVATRGKVKISLLDANGGIVRTLLDDHRDRGAYELETNLSGLVNGVYYCKIETPNGSRIKRILKQ